MQLRYQNLPERIEQLQAHIKSRRGRGDLQAHRRLVELQKALQGITSSLTMDDLLKNYYTADSIVEQSYGESLFFAFLKKTERSKESFIRVINSEFEAAQKHADEEDAKFATGVFCPTEEEIAKHRKK